MPSVVRFTLAKSQAFELAEKIELDVVLATLPVSLSEDRAGRWQILVYLSPGLERRETAGLKRLWKALFGKPIGKLTIEKLLDTDWVAKSLEGLPPVRAGRYVVHGAHDRHSLRPNDIAIEIEAAQAFGTGHHGTTAGCLLAIDRHARSRPIKNALDIGTGSGVLAIAIAKAAKAPVLASDIDPVAVHVARGNAKLNGIAGLVTEVVASNLARRIFRVGAPYDLVVANILAGPLLSLAPQICRHVAAGGTLILSGLLPGQRARIVATYHGQGMSLSRSMHHDGWLTITFCKGTQNRKGRSRWLRP